jgi:isoleucyl-tRNA synthetase
MQVIKDLVVQGHSLRKSANIKLRQPLASFTYISKTELTEEFEAILADELNVKSVKSATTVEFDTDISPKLRQEGLARELERLVQELRKQNGLKVGEMIELSYDTSDEELKAAFELLDTKKTYLKGIRGESGLKGAAAEIEGKKITIALSKSN